MSLAFQSPGNSSLTLVDVLAVRRACLLVKNGAIYEIGELPARLNGFVEVNEEYYTQ